MTESPTAQSSAHDPVLAYVADLELEVDRLRRQGRFVAKETTKALTLILRRCSAAPDDPFSAREEVGASAGALLELVRDLRDSPGYHPAHDQVVAIAVRPLVEQVYRWQRRLTGAGEVELRVDLGTDHVEWFPTRLRHIIDNLLANALRHRDKAGSAQWVAVALHSTDDGYELSVSDNGPGPSAGEERPVLELFFRSSPARAATRGAGLAVVQLLVEQSGGTMLARPREGRGTEIVLSLPRYDLLDYLE
jgi:signal transduction histidine kinase